MSMPTLLEILKKTTEFLEKRGVENARLNAEWLIGQGLGLTRMQLYLQFERPLTEAELEKIRPLVKRRGNREPLQYVLGTAEFGGLKLKVDRRALIPRPETEYLVEELKNRLAANPPPRVLDLGTGSGAIALALAAAWLETSVTAVDTSEAALQLARENADALGLASRVRLIRSDWFAALPPDDRFELVVANPPYLSDQETDEAQPEVKDFEPRTALSAGPDGAKMLEEIIRSAGSRLVPGGLLALETGPDQHPRLLSLATQCGFSQAESRRDLTGRDRFVLAVL
jgi:release factor glutamine methyltransferase